jgi:peptidyl-tRNA hydrolase
MNIEDIRKLLKQKENEKMSSEDEKRISTLKVILKDDNIFFNIDGETACGILKFLGIQEDKIVETYFKLISFEQYKKNKGYSIKKEDYEEEK